MEIQADEQNKLSKKEEEKEWSLVRYFMGDLLDRFDNSFLLILGT